MENSFLNVFSNSVIQAAFFGWLIAQIAKVPIHFLVNKQWDIRKVTQSGGMPSSHSSSACAAACMIGLNEGFGSSMFGLAFVFTMVVMYDAAGVRRAAGKHAEILNDIMDTFKGKQQFSDERLKEWIGHTPFEVAVGAILGILIGIVSGNVL